MMTNTSTCFSKPPVLVILACALLFVIIDNEVLRMQFITKERNVDRQFMTNELGTEETTSEDRIIDNDAVHMQFMTNGLGTEEATSVDRIIDNDAVRMKSMTNELGTEEAASEDRIIDNDAVHMKFMTNKLGTEEATSEDRIIDNDAVHRQCIATELGTEEATSEDREIKELSTPLAIEKNRKYVPITLDDLMEKYDSDPPVNNLAIPECLANPSSNTLPLVYMSLGRSGSTIIWLMLSNLTKSKDYGKTIELTGTSLHGNMFFFDTTIPVEKKREKTDPNIDSEVQILRNRAKCNEYPALHNAKHGEWMINYLCRLRAERPDGLVGFKWKPVLNQFMERGEARESLQLLASLASEAAAVGQNPPIQVLRSTRNPIDKQLGNWKHNQKPLLSDHCDEGDEECIKRHERKIFIDKPYRLFNLVMNTVREEKLVDEMMNALNISFVSVSYDTLYYPDHISEGEDEWNKMIQLVKPSSERVSWADVQNSMSLAATTKRGSHKDLIENWEEVYEKFRGSEYEQYLRM